MVWAHGAPDMHVRGTAIKQAFETTLNRTCLWVCYTNTKNNNLRVWCVQRGFAKLTGSSVNNSFSFFLHSRVYNPQKVVTLLYRKSYLWSGFSFFLLRLKVRWHCHFTLGLWKQRRRKSIRYDLVPILSCNGKIQSPLLVTSSKAISQWNPKLVYRLLLLSLRCRRIERHGCQQLETSRLISLSQECRGLTGGCSRASDLTKHRLKRHAWPERHLS